MYVPQTQALRALLRFLCALDVAGSAGVGQEFFPTPQRAIVTGTAIGLLGAVGWEIIEVILGAMGAAISNTLADSIFDVFLGVCGGALGGWFADRYLDRIFGRSRHDPHQRRVK
jgi:hypothetical protein